MSPTVFIDGAAGTTGLDIHDRLTGRRDLVLVALDEDRRKDRGARRDALNDADLVVLCLPDAAAREAVGLIDNGRTRVIDASSAHRTAEGWTYGFAEIENDGAARIRAADRVSNPGCYPTGFLALVRPLISAGLLPTDALLTVNAASGYSGGGKAMIAEHENGASAAALRCYALSLAHKHVAEMTRHAGLHDAPVFQPAVANTRRGMIVEVPLHAAQLTPGRSPVEIAEVLTLAYRASPVVRVAREAVDAVNIEDDAGTDRLTLHVFVSPDERQARLVATLDNLGKGAGGAAVQNLNIMAGLDPLAGLHL